MNWTDVIRGQATLSYKAARGLIQMVDDSELDWRPETGHNWLTVGQLIRHITNACGNCARGFVTGNWREGDHGIDPTWKPKEGGPPMPSAEDYLSFNRAEALAALDVDEKTFYSVLAEAGEKRLDSERSTAPWAGPERCLGEHFLTCLQHIDSHKQQLFHYWKLQDKPVHTGTLWGM